MSVKMLKFLWVESSDTWSLVHPASSGTATVTSAIARKKIFTLGAITANTPIILTHNLNTLDVVVRVREVSSGDEWDIDNNSTSVDTFSFTFADSYAANLFTVTIVG